MENLQNDVTNISSQDSVIKDDWNQAFDTCYDGTIQYKKLPEPDTEATAHMKDNFVFFALSALIYAVLYTFCMFQNDAGIA